MYLIFRKGWVKFLITFGFMLLALGVVFGQVSLFYYAKIAPVLAQGKPLILIDAGHGGRDPGAIYGDIYEKEINLDMAKELEKSLNKMGYRVSMTRTKDTNLVNWKDNGSFQRASLWQRVQLAKKRNAQVFISIHCNSDRNTSYSGPQTFYHEKSLKGKVLAEAIQEELVKINPSKRGAIPGNYYLLNNTTCTAVIVELGYLSNPRDRLLLCSPGDRSKLAKAIAKGIEKSL